MATFTDQSDEFLVELIAKNPPLYDSQLKTYKDNVIRDNIWEHIGNKLNKTSKYLLILLFHYYINSTNRH